MLKISLLEEALWKEGYSSDVGRGSVSTGQPLFALTLTFPLSCDPARSASHMVLTKTGVKVTMIPYSRSRPMSSEDARESPPSQKVRKPSELITGGGIPEPPDIAHEHRSLSVLRLDTRACKLRYLQSNFSLSCGRLGFPFKALHGPHATSLRPPICSLYMGCT